MKNLFVYLTAILLLAPVALAIGKEGSMKLLAVSEEGNLTFGSLADLSLEIKEGSGRVFIETFPLTKLDTQITTRFANQIACNYLGDSCEKYDFFYTIKAESATIGGPSAGAATALLTIAVLNDIKLDYATAITGTINSGDLIGPVGGIKEKVDAAIKGGIKKIIIPQGEMYIKENNKTLNLSEYGGSRGVKIIEVSNLDDAIYEFAGKKIRSEPQDFSIDENYLATMREIASELCNKSTDVLESILKVNYKNQKIIGNDSLKLEEEAFNLTKKADAAYAQGRYYSAASFCYGASLKYTQMNMLEQNLTVSDIIQASSRLKKDMSSFEKEFNSKKISTIADLESYMVVNERLFEAEENLKDEITASEKNNITEAINSLSSAIVRVYSAKLWSKFFGTQGLKFALENKTLEESCQKKISEAEERYQYAGLYVPDILGDINIEIKRAHSLLENGKYALCLFTASKAKADSDIILSSISTERLDLLINQKLTAAKKVIAIQAAKGMFPIFGYSYFEYSDMLKKENVFSALIYSEYAIELSNLDIYFIRENKKAAPTPINYEMLYVFVLGAGTGMMIYSLILVLTRKKANRKK